MDCKYLIINNFRVHKMNTQQVVSTNWTLRLPTADNA